MQSLQGPLAAVLSLSLITGTNPVPAQAAPRAATGGDQHAAVRPEYRGQLQGDERIFHALNRFTFGPRPGDVETVRSIGLDRWFEQQLQPNKIEDSDLQARLAEFPAMQWNTQDLLYRLPSNAVIRQVIDGKAPMPDKGVLHAVYANQVARVSAKREQQEQKKQLAATVAETGANGMKSSATPAGSGRAEEATMTLLSSMDNPSDSAGSVAPVLVSSILNLPPQQRVSRLIGLPPEEAEAFFKTLKGPERAALTAGLTPDLRLTVEALQNPERAVTEELMSARLTRDIYSNAQLQEVMTDFWLNHFNVYLRKSEATPYYLVSYERDVIRPRALGKFEDLLEAVAHSPAMLLYLDNAESTGPDSLAAERAKVAAERNPDKKRKAPEGLNENYARELMELHTLGVDGGYTQADVIQAARILTGWTVDRSQRGGGFLFDERRHEPGTKKVLGQKFKDRGERQGEDLLHMLATRPATAQFLARKLAVRFVSDDPPRALVDRMAKAYLSSGGDISAVLRAMYRSPEFWSQDSWRAKVKTPLDYVVSAARASNAQIVNTQPLIKALREMGMPLYECIPPTGYKWDAADWVSTGALVNRMNFALALSSNRLNGISMTWVQQPAGSGAVLDVNQALAQQESGPPEEEARLEALLIGGGVSDSTRSAVLQQFQQQNTQDGAATPVMAQPRHAPAAAPLEKQDQLLAGLLLGSPEFQRR